jgi:hypothetical protein
MSEVSRARALVEIIERDYPGLLPEGLDEGALKDVAADLRRASAALASTGDAGLLRIADALSLWRESDATTLESALGLPPTWRSAMRRRARDRLYDSIAATCFPDLSGRPLANAIAGMIRDYETTAWPADRDAGRRPHGPNGLVFDLLMLGGRRLDHESLRRIVVGKSSIANTHVHDCIGAEQE